MGVEDLRGGLPLITVDFEGIDFVYITWNSEKDRNYHLIHQVRKSSTIIGSEFFI